MPTQLQELEAKIAAAKSQEAPEPTVADHHSQAQLAWRMVIELVAGIGIGFGLGYGMDSAFGTLPIFMVVMTLLGFIAGVRTMLRSAEEIQKGSAGTPAEDEDKARGS